MSIEARLKRLEERLPEPGKLVKVVMYREDDVEAERQADELEAAGVNVMRIELVPLRAAEARA
ncbi:MAG TPA: hypothetical protein VI457_10935 [Methylococcaceae bacterium]|nr:hypothetical protein [Methylococcaceae bacterium]